MPITYSTIEKLRQSVNAPGRSIVATLSDQGVIFWQGNAEDKTSEDDGRSCIRNAKKQAYTRILGAPRAAWLGVLPGVDISKVLQDYIDRLPTEAPLPPLVFENGRHFVSKTIDLKKTGMSLLCDGGKAMLVATGEQRGPLLVTGPSQQHGMLRHMGFVGRGYGEVRDGDKRCENPADQRYYDQALAVFGSVYDVSQCIAMETVGHGFASLAKRIGSDGRNTSNSRFYYNRISRVGGAGIIAAGADANAHLFYGNDVRESGWRILDLSSFPGVIFGNMGHYTPMGGVRVTSESSNAVVFGEYDEESPNSASDLFWGYTTAFGNRHAAGVEVGPFADVKDPRSMFVLQQGKVGVAGSFGHKKSPFPLIQFGDQFSPLKTAYSSQERFLQEPWANLVAPLINGKRYQVPFASVEAARKTPIMFEGGDTIAPALEGGVYECFKGGSGGMVLEGVTAAAGPGLGGGILLTGETDRVAVGMMVAAAGHDFDGKEFAIEMLVTRIQKNGDRVVIEGAPEVKIRFDNVPLGYAAPEFRPLFDTK